MPPSAPVPIPGADPLTRAETPRPKPRILVVEDDPEMRSLLEEYLASSGFDATAAPDVETAFARLREGPVDLVVSDLSLPDESGITFLRKLTGAGGPVPRFIVITAFGDWRSYAEALALGAARYMTKPFRMEELVREIRSALVA